MKTKFILFPVFIFVLLLVTGCSKLNENMPAEPVLKVHDDGIITYSSSAFHGKLLAGSQWDYMGQCARCHARDFSGVSGKTCLKCHSATYLHMNGTIYRNQISHADSANFHGKLIATSEKWSLTRCQKCHGTNYAGLPGSTSCLNCHTGSKGPESCNMCHGTDITGAPPRALNGDTSSTYKGVGLHQNHLMGAQFSNNVECKQCHTPVLTYAQSGHIDSDGKAEVTWGALAKQVTNSDSTINSTWITYEPAIGAVKPAPVYNSSTATCSNVYCHGAFKNGNYAAVSWVSAGLKCGSCHGDGNNNPLPKGALHKGKTNCACHDGFGVNYTNKAKHIDGKITIFGNDYVY